MSVATVLDRWQHSPAIAPHLTALRWLPARPARYGPWPAALDPRLRDGLQHRGIARLYSHQAQAVSAALAGRHVVVVSPTASGKTLCYNLPVLHTLLREPAARALYLFPTKALAHDQLAELHAWARALDVPLRAFTYDGDTPATARQQVRVAGSLVVTNPDMLHAALLPQHTQWCALFEHLRYVIIDELHTYRGPFGSHLANVLRRLKRLAAHYGSRPQFLLASATIGNPRELAEQLLDEPVELVDDNGAPTGPRCFAIYNPPAIEPALGIRRSALLAARDLAADLLQARVQTIVFARSRLAVELLVTHLRADRRVGDNGVRGYRGGYLPSERRAIEQGLRSGEVRCVVATNALELGIDIGGLDACVLVGYPGSIASTWQQVGRAGRRQALSLAVLVATSSPLDQFLAAQPDYLFATPVEEARIHPNNLYIRTSHLQCAAFERPFERGESFGGEDTPLLLDFLAEQEVLVRAGDRWYWMADAFPAQSVSLRSAAIDNFVIVDLSAPGQPRVIGELDRWAVPTLLHEEAIYLHEGRQYQVERLDWTEKKAFVRRVAFDYYTDAELAVELKPLSVEASAPLPHGARHWGEVALTFQATIFKKLKLLTHENVGWGQIQLPQETYHTAACWLTVERPNTSPPPEAWEAGLLGLGHLQAHLAPLYLLCDPRDLGWRAEVRSPFTGQPTIYLYERVGGGVGLAERLYALHAELLAAAATHLERCGCAEGCPSCVGPPPPAAAHSSAMPKPATRHLLRLLRGTLAHAD